MSRTSYSKLYTKNIPQSEPLNEKQVVNSAGGYVFQLDNWQRLERFLILGSDTNTYYQTAQKLTKENSKCVEACWSEDPQRTANLIKDISVNGRAPKNDSALFALALGSVHPNIEARQNAHAAAGTVARTGTHLFQFMHYTRELGKGSGRGIKRFLANWYLSKDTNYLALQAIKYKNRKFDNKEYNHKRCIELSNMGAGKDASSDRIALYRWMRGKEDVNINDLPDIVQAHLEVLKLENNKKDALKLINLIDKYKLPWEALNTWALKNPDVWEALVPHAGIIALVRNLGNMGACGALGLQNWKAVADRFNKTAIRKSKIHPFNILTALAVYRHGTPYAATNYSYARKAAGKETTKTWTPVPQMLDALDSAFYMAFPNVEPTNKRILLALDVSGSMTAQLSNSPLSVREAAAAMCLVTLATEPNCAIVGYTCSGTRERKYNSSYTFNHGISPLTISAKQRLDDVVRYTGNLSFGGTDCALPFLWAQSEKHLFDAVISYTDSETWNGQVHPQKALDDYRKHSDIFTKAVCCGMTATNYTIMDPQDPGSLNICGMDTNVPALISNFIRD